MLLLALNGLARAQDAEPPDPTLDAALQHLLSTADISETVISPDHRLVAWVQSSASKVHPSSQEDQVYVAATDGAPRPARISAATSADDGHRGALLEKAAAWAPDSHSLAFLSDAGEPGQLQLYVVKMSGARIGGAVRRLTQLKGYLADPQWSRDGRSIALLFTENAPRASGPLEAVAPDTGVIGQHIYEQRIAVVDVSNGSVRIVSPADLYVYEYDWSPDGRTFAATAAHGSGDNNWYVAQLYTIEAASGTTRSILSPGMQIAVPRWSPDGRSIAFIGGLMSDEGIASGDVYVVPATGGAARNLTPHLDGSAYWLTWMQKNEGVLLAQAVDGGTGFEALDVRTGVLRSLWRGAETVKGPANFARGLSLAADRRTSAVIRESYGSPPQVWTGPIGNWRPLSQPGGSAPDWGNAQSVHWRSDSFSVQGWLVPPAHVDPGRKYPMVVWVHGGPAWLSAPTWPSVRENNTITLLASHGYFVFFPNFRGSAGFGEQFKRANVKDFGGGDLRDILAGVRQVVSTYPVDEHRVGITGWSYGGYMTMWAITQTGQFRAAVVGAGLSDWLSYYGENGIDEWMIPYFGASVYDDPAVYAKSSPINFIKRVHTPALLLVGEGDVECPPPQSFEYWHALQSFHVKSQLVVYPHEGHRFTDPVHVRDALQRLSKWFDSNMPPESSSAQGPSTAPSSADKPGRAP